MPETTATVVKIFRLYLLPIGLLMCLWMYQELKKQIDQWVELLTGIIMMMKLVTLTYQVCRYE